MGRRLFSYKVRHRWETLREGPYRTDKLMAYIDSIASMLSIPQLREFEKWPVLGVNIWRETSGYEQRTSYQDEVDYLKDFLVQRWTWMDNELAIYENPNSTTSSQLNPYNTRAVV